MIDDTIQNMTRSVVQVVQVDKTSYILAQSHSFELSRMIFKISNS